MLPRTTLISLNPASLVRVRAGPFSALLRRSLFFGCVNLAVTQSFYNSTLNILKVSPVTKER